jgi:hypothetical protein
VQFLSAVSADDKLIAARAEDRWLLVPLDGGAVLTVAAGRARGELFQRHGDLALSAPVPRAILLSMMGMFGLLSR